MLSCLIRRAVFTSCDTLFNSALVVSQARDLAFVSGNASAGHRRTRNYLHDLLQHAVASTDFYQALVGAKFKDFPVINKDVIRAEFPQFVSRSFSGRELHSMSTSGSTGTPFSVVQDKRKRSRVIAELKYFAHCTGARPYEPMAFLRVLTAKTRRSWYQQFRENLWRLDSPKLDEENLESFRSFLKRKRIKALLSYPSTYDIFVNYLLSKGDCPEDFEVQTIIGGGEVFLETTRAKLRRVFGCRVVSRYSNNEMGVLGQDTDESRRINLNHASYHFEILHPDRDEPAAPGQLGRIVITDLFNYALPMIRYDTGDIGAWSQENSETSQFAWPGLGELHGRQWDIIYDTRGSPVSPHVLAAAGWSLQGARQFQLIQKTRNGYILRINGPGGPGLSGALREIRGALGPDAEIAVEQVEEVPVLSSGKRRMTVCEWRAN